MTLTTKIAIVEPTPAFEVFVQANELIGGQNARWDHVPVVQASHGYAEYHNLPWQGLPAWVWVRYGADHPMAPDPEDSRDLYPPVDSWSIVVYFDTSYGYVGPGDSNCNDLHAWLVRELGAWLDSCRLTWFWYDEYEGRWHPSTTPPDYFGRAEIGDPRAAPVG